MNRALWTWACLWMAAAFVPAIVRGGEGSADDPVDRSRKLRQEVRRAWGESFETPQVDPSEGLRKAIEDLKRMRIKPASASRVATVPVAPATLSRVMTSTSVSKT